MLVSSQYSLISARSRVPLPPPEFGTTKKCNQTRRRQGHVLEQNNWCTGLISKATRINRKSSTSMQATNRNNKRIRGQTSPCSRLRQSHWQERSKQLASQAGQLMDRRLQRTRLVPARHDFVYRACAPAPVGMHDRDVERGSLPPPAQSRLNPAGLSLGLMFLLFFGGIWWWARAQRTSPELNQKASPPVGSQEWAVWQAKKAGMSPSSHT